jgi:hypothetical protein
MQRGMVRPSGPRVTAMADGSSKQAKFYRRFVTHWALRIVAQDLYLRANATTILYLHYIRSLRL